MSELVKGGQGYASFRWYDSKAMEFLRGLPREVMIYTNEPGAVYLYTGTPGYVLPDQVDPVTAAARPGFEQGLTQLQEDVHSGAAVLALFSGGDTPAEDAAQLSAGLSLVHKSGVGYGPKILQEQITALLSQNASAVMTHVPGPTNPVYFAGRRIEELNFWVPQSGGIGMGVSILSYNGRIQFGLIADAGLVPDPDRIVGHFQAELDKLMWLTLMSPWGDEGAEPAPAVPESGPAKPSRVARANKAGKPKGGKVPGRSRGA